MEDHILKSAIASSAVKRKSEGFHIISSEGYVQDWIIDLRASFMRSDILRAIADRFWDRYGARQPFQIAGPETASIPLLTAILLAAPDAGRDLRASVVRKTRKGYGLGNFVEGNPGQEPVILIDDLVNSGDGIRHCIEVLRENRLKVDEVFCVIDYCNDLSRELMAEQDFSLQSLFKLSDFGLDPGPPLKAPVEKFRKLWSNLSAKANTFHVVPKSAPVLERGLLFRGCDAGRMQAFFAETGEMAWDFEAPGTDPAKGIWSTPAIADGRLYFGAYNGMAYCLDAATGSEVWSEQCGDWIGASPLIVTRHDLVCFGVEYARQWSHGAIAALHAGTGTLAWHHLVSGLQHSSPAYWEGGDLVIWGTADYEMLGIEARTGRVVWSFETQRSVKYAPYVDEEKGLVAFASFDRFIYLLSAATGEELGRWETRDICYTTPLIYANRLYCGSGDGSMYVVNLVDMIIEKEIPIGSRIYSSPRLIAGQVVFGANCGRVFELDPDSLDVRPVLMMKDAVTNAIAANVDGSVVYVSTAVNHLTAYGRATSI